MDHKLDPGVRSITNRADRGPGSLRAALDFEGDAPPPRHTVTLEFGRLLSDEELASVVRRVSPPVRGWLVDIVPELVPERPVV